MSAPKLLFRVTRQVEDSGAWGTIWLLMPDGDLAPFAVTLERTYESGKRIKIPDGIWYCTRRRYNKGKYPTWEIHIPDHKFILFHKGNKELHSDGCVLVAENFHDFDPAKGLQDIGVGSSAAGFGELMSLSSDVEHFFVEFFTVPGRK